MPSAVHRRVFLKEEPVTQVEEKAETSSSWTSVDDVGAPLLDLTPSKSSKTTEKQAPIDFSSSQKTAL
jgi:hypothetical protein